MEWRKEYADKLMTANKAAALIQSGDRIFSSMSNCAPLTLQRAVCDRYRELKDVTLYVGVMTDFLDCLKPVSKGRLNGMRKKTAPGSIR